MSVQRKKSSVVWNFFTVCDVEKELAKCDLCHQTLSFKSSISNLKKHIERKHPTIELKATGNTKIRNISTVASTSTSIISDETDVGQSVELQQTLLPVSTHFIVVHIYFFNFQIMENKWLFD